MLAEQDSVDVPEPPVMLVAERVQDRFVEFVVTARATVPVKLFTGATVIVEVPATPALTVTLVGLAVTVKSWTEKLRVWLAVCAPPVAVTVALKFPVVEAVQVTVNDPVVPVILVTLSVQTRLVDVVVTDTFVVPRAALLV